MAQNALGIREAKKIVSSGARAGEVEVPPELVLCVEIFIHVQVSGIDMRTTEERKLEVVPAIARNIRQWIEIE